MSNPTSPNAQKQSIAAAACWMALACAVLSFGAFAIAVSQFLLARDVTISAFGVMACTLPVTILSAIVAVWLAGPRRCKLAWIALGIYALQFIIGHAVQAYLTRL